MALITTSNPASMDYKLQTYFSRRLLDVQTDTLRLAQLGLKAPLPARSGSKTVRWFKPNGVDTALRGAATSASSVVALTEGTVPTVFREIDYSYIEATLAQYGEVAKISDVETLIDAYEPLKQVVDTFGLDSAMSIDTLCRAAIVGSGSMTHGKNNAAGYQSERFAGVDWSATNDTSQKCFDALAALSGASAKMTRATILGAVTRLAQNKAPKLNGRYVAIIDPTIQHDLVQDTDYKTAFYGQGFKGPFNGSIGVVDGVEFMVANNPLTETEYGTYAAAGAIVTSLFLGKDAFGVVQLSGTNSPYKPAVTILKEPDKSDPLGQFVIAGWKVFYTAKGLDPLNVVAVRSKTTFA